ncbi:hypothetical protein EX30DRAFT_361183 [Ascodesmis nigricans]|uniref:Uncharacterized protein n=1 Tax=Ascodesmis nigricans TaxID=341454 RepID=A0A4S2N7M7_9PEZI|nr:hypothetical protein EX30DRAFT_361183 [Ascodesmis nigricans]
MADTTSSPQTTQSESRPPPVRQRSSASIHASDDAGRTSTTSSRAHHGQHHAHHGHKKFVVSTRHGHAHAHTRVPSHGRNMNKLGGQGGSRTSLHQHATSPKHDKGTSERRSQRQRRPKFEIGSPEDDEEEDVEDIEEVEEEGEGQEVQVSQQRPPQRSSSRTVVNENVVGGMKKSASTKSLELRDRRPQHERGESSHQYHPEQESREPPQEPEQIFHNGHQTTIPAPPQAEPEESSHPQLPAHRANGAPPQFQPNSSTRPLTPQESGGPVTATNISQPTHNPRRPSHSHARTPHTPVTPAHSLPSSQEQPLTSRFIHSPSSASAADSVLTRRGADNIISQTPPNLNPLNPLGILQPESAQPINKSSSTTSSRTQKKLWLQRQSSQQEMPEGMSYYGLAASAAASPGEFSVFQTRVQREFERVARDYMNVRRFRNPVCDALERVRKTPGQRRVVPKRPASADGVGNLGLSQSLREAGEVRVGGGGARSVHGVGQDDGGAQEGRAEEGNRQTEVEMILRRLWKHGEMLESNE